jgi:hypothetical protein
LNDENLFTAYLNWWQSYVGASVAMYSEFMKSYMDFTKSWMWPGTTTAQLPQLNGAFGMASMVKGVDIIGANKSGDKQITLYLRYTDNGIAPPISIQAGGINFDVDASRMFKAPFGLSGVLSGSSKVSAGWRSPLELKVELVGHFATLNDVNIVGISIQKQ